VSRDYISDPAEDSAFSLRAIGETLDTIETTLLRIAAVLEADAEHRWGYGQPERIPELPPADPALMESR
jgi:hypothetical protein